MSHASVLVCGEVENFDDRVEVEAMVTSKMTPFDENGEWFKDGSRWDWWVIGGRYTGNLDGYDPQKDVRNFETCSGCGGGGVRPGGLEQFGQEWFDRCNGCNGCQGKGIRVKWPTQWVKHHGDVCQVKLIEKDKLQSAYAFLRNGSWNERERLGFFGGSTATEEERSGNGDDPDLLSRTHVLAGPDGVELRTWNEPWEIWEERFWERFMAELPKDEVVVLVDYHV